MKKRPLLAILALLMLSLVAVGCPRIIVEVEIEPPPPGPYPAPLKEWSRTFGGPHSETARSIHQTACGGFIIAGTTDSFGAGEDDFWLVKTDPQGNKEWSQTFGGPYCDWAYSAQQTADGGFIIAGTTWSFGDGEGDFWLVKTDGYGNKQWSRTFGGRHEDWATSVQQTACGGFIIAGHTRSFGAGHFDFWLVKTDAYGIKEWSQTFGGPHKERAFSVEQTRCGGFIIAAYTWSFGRGDSDFWVVKTDPKGDKEWSQTFGGHTLDNAYSVQQTRCGGFIVAGRTHSFGAEEGDFWLVKTDPQGIKEWSRTFGGPGFDRATSVKQTVCSGFIIAGRTTTLTIFRGVPIGGVPIGVPPLPPPPGACIWVVKTDAYGNKEWTQIFGTLREMDIAYSVKQTACGGFIVAGMTESFGAGEADFWLIKLAPEE